MATEVENKVASLSGLFKMTFADNIKWLQPKGLRFQNDFEFMAKEKQPGDFYNAPVVLQGEHGFTYKAPRSGAFLISPARAGVMKNAKIEGYQLLLESIMDYEASSRATSGGARAFQAASQLMVEQMWLGMRKRHEIALLYGQMGLGVVESVAQVASTSVVTVKAAEFAMGIWSGMVGAPIEFFNAALTTKRGNTTPGTATAIARIRSVDLDARKITFETDGTGADIDLTAWNTAVDAGAVGTDVMFFEGEVVAGPTHNNFPGLHKILTNTGTIFEINAAIYDLWKANTISAGSANMSFETTQRAIAKAMGKGLDENIVLYLAPVTWATMLTDQAGLRRHGDPNKKAQYEIGAESIKFFSQTGSIEIKSSIYVKEGYGYLLAPANWKRVGATDYTFRLQGGREDEFFFHHPTKAGYVLRCYQNASLFSDSIGTATLINLIDNA